MDAPTISAFAAAFAAAGAFALAAIQFYIGYRQSKAALRSAEAAMLSAKNAGRHRVAEFRQAWIYKVIDALRDHHSILMNKPAGHRPTAEENKALTASRTQLEILLNPNEVDHIALLQKIDEIDQSTTATEQVAKAAEMLITARMLLKQEWVRLKEELQNE
jgi:hypothetical protein